LKIGNLIKVTRSLWPLLKPHSITPRELRERRWSKQSRN
jgi:hypothetical protein